MRPPYSSLAPERILQHARRLEPLARRLVRDDDFVDELVQETAIRALGRAPMAASELSRWMVTVVRRLAHEHHRTNTSRSAREAAAARPEAQPSAAESAERLEALELVVQTLRELKNPYRATITQYYLEGRRYEEIAKLRQVTEGTLRGEVSRGLALMREKLDRRFGHDRNAWCAALAPMLSDMPVALAWKSKLTSAGAWMAACAALFLIVAWTVRRNSAKAALDTPTSIVAPPAHASSGKSAAPGGSSRTPLGNVESAQLRTLQVVVEATAEPIPAATVTYWPLPDGVESMDLIEEWFADGSIDQRMAELGTTVVADEHGNVTLPATAEDVFVVGSAGQQWGRALLRSSQRNPARLSLRDDWDLVVRVRDAVGVPVGGSKVALSPLGYCGDDGSPRLPEATLSPVTGAATLRHVGWVKNTTKSICDAYTFVCGTVGGHGLDEWIAPSSPAARPLEIRLPAPVGYIEFVIDRSRCACPDDQQHHVELARQAYWGGSYVAVESCPGTPVMSGEVFMSADARWDWPESTHDHCRCPPYEHVLTVSAGQTTVVRLVCTTADSSEPEPPRPKPALTARLVSADGAPLAMATVKLASDVSSDAEATDALGYEYDVEVISSSTGELRFVTEDEDRASGFGTTVAGVVMDSAGSPEATFVVSYACDEHTKEEPIVVEPIPIRFSGTVVHADGTPAANARVTTQGRLDIFSIADACGRFSLRAADSEIAQVLIATLADGSLGATLARAGDSEIVVMIPGLRLVRGAVQVSSTFPRNELYVSATRFRTESAALGVVTEPPLSSACVRVSESGQFSLGEVEEGNYQVRLLWTDGYTNEGMLSAHVVAEQFVVIDSTRAGPVELDLGADTRVARVTPVGDSGEALGHQWARCDSHFAEWIFETVDFTGNTRVVVWPNGACIRIRAEGYYDINDLQIADNTVVEMTRRDPVTIECIGTLPKVESWQALELVLTDPDDTREDRVAFNLALDEGGRALGRSAGPQRCRAAFTLMSVNAVPPQCEAILEDNAVEFDVPLAPGAVIRMSAPTAEQVAHALEVARDKNGGFRKLCG